LPDGLIEESKPSFGTGWLFAHRIFSKKIEIIEN